MAIDSNNIKDREWSKFVESPTRPGQAAIETITNVQVYSDTLAKEATNLQILTATQNMEALMGDSINAAAAINVSNSIVATAYDLNAAAYSVTSNEPADYLLDAIEFNFSTTEPRDITVTSSNGTILFQALADTSLDIVIEDMNRAFNANDNYTIDISQTAGACTVTLLAVVKKGSILIEDNTINARILNNTKVSTDNSSTAILTNGASYTGTWEDTTNYNSVTVAVKTDQSGLLYIQFSPDGTNLDSSLSFSVAAATNEVHRITCTRKYMRVVFTNNSGADQTYFRLQSILGTHPILTSPLNGTIQTDSDTVLTRSILYGKKSDGNYYDVPLTDEGHLEMAIHGPLLPFGSLHVESLRPIIHISGTYNIHPSEIVPRIVSSGTTNCSDGLLSVSTGTSSGASASLISRRRARYSPGQGIVARFTAMYTTPVANSYQIAGVGTRTDGVFFGYKDTDFGIIYRAHGESECRTLTITTASSTNQNITVTLNGTNYTVAVTNSGNIQRTVWEISQGSYSGWKADAVGATVVFVADTDGAKNTGAYSITATTAVGTFAQTKAGASANETWIPQSSWNGDTLDGNGPSTYNIDPTKLNVFQIGIQYLGAGAITFSVETVQSNSENAVWTVVHVLKLPNTLTKPSFGNPSFPFKIQAVSTGSTTNLTVSTASVAVFQEGEKYLHGPRYSYINAITTVGSTNYQAIFTVKNKIYHSIRANQAVVNMLNVTGALKHTSPCIYYLIVNGSLGGNPNFSSQDSYSCATYDTSATTVTVSSPSQIIWSGHLGDTGNLSVDASLIEDFTLEPGEWITLAAKSVTGSPSNVTGALNTREDQ